MNAARTAIERARAAGIILTARDGRVLYDAPLGAMTPDLLADLRRHKALLLALLQASLAWTEREDVRQLVEDLYRDRWHPDRIARELGLTRPEVAAIVRRH